MEQTFKYFAFISYNAKDTAWGKRVQRKLERYRMSATLCREHGWNRTPIKPVFFAPTDIQPGGLTAELQDRLRASRHLIVICSPNSAKSEWVGREIAFFHSLGRTKDIHFFIVDGQPHSGNPDTECFNPVVKELGLPEILGANIHERIYRWPWLNRERAYVQLISKLLGVEFDAIWQRHKRLMMQRAAAWAVGGVAVAAALVGVWCMNQPIDVEMSLQETSAHNVQLPPLENAVVTMTLDNETKQDTIRTIEGNVVLTNIPHRFVGQPVHVTLTCRDFLDVDTTLNLSERVVLNVRRDPAVYGHVRVLLWDEGRGASLPNTRVEIEGMAVTSDAEGRVTLTVPLEAQRKAYAIRATTPFIDDSIHMPNGPDDAITVNP